MKLRPYQEEALQAIYDSDKQNNLIMSSVGSGKTIIFSALATRAKGRTLILVPSTELREQSIEKLKIIDPDSNVGSVQAQLDKVDSKIVVATRQSLSHSKSNRLKRMLNHGNFEYLIVDECHQAPEQIKRVISGLNKDIKVIGFTATPYTKQCIKIFGQPIFRRTIIDMIEQNYLVEPVAILVRSQTDISHVKTQNGDFQQRDLERTVNNDERNDLIVEAYKKYAHDRKLTLVFAAGCDHGKSLTEEFQSKRISCAYIDGETPKEQRKKIIQMFKDKKIKVLVNVLTLTTGFDVPETDCIILSRPSKSRVLFEQIVGRGLRLAEGKTDCLLIDIQDVVKKHDLMDISSVFNVNMNDGESYKQAKERVKREKEEAQRKEEEERLERERIERERLELVAERIRLFNKDLKKAFVDSKMDWFKVNHLTYALSYAPHIHFVIENYDDKFVLYGCVTEKDNKSVKYLNEYESLKDAMDYAEMKCGINIFSDPDARWKHDDATEAQKKYCQWANTKWEVSCYFNGKTLGKMLSDFRKVSV